MSQVVRFYGLLNLDLYVHGLDHTIAQITTPEGSSGRPENKLESCR